MSFHVAGRLQLAHGVLLHMLAAQPCESITPVARKRTQVMERSQDTFRGHSLGQIEQIDIVLFVFCFILTLMQATR